MTRVCLTYDFDAVSVWLHDPDLEATPTNRSRGRFGAEIGAPRLLDLHAELDLSSTWFVPGHTIESFPEVCGRLAATDHEIAHHGWTHRPPGTYESRAAERDDLERGIQTIESLTGAPPAGYRSPSWDLSPWTIELLTDLGFRWDSSGMARDHGCYYHRRGERAPSDGPYDPGEPTDLVCVPVSWTLDDFPRLAIGPDAGTGDEAAIFRTWREAFDWAHEHLADGVFVLTMHPQVIGRGPRLAHLREFLEHLVDTPDVDMVAVSEAAEGFRTGA